MQGLTSALAELSEIQLKAVVWTEGPFMLLAGPGSGKTRVLACHVARLIEQSEGNSFKVLGLTFTNKAADEMRRRIVEYLPSREHRFYIGTFHSFCSRVLRQHGLHLDIRPNFTIYSHVTDLNAILGDAVEGLKKQTSLITELDKKTLPVIHRLKASLVPPSDCRTVFSDEEMGERMALVYPAYEEELRRHNALDFDSLILRAYELFSRYPAFVEQYRTVFKHICVDEFQDTNDAQNKLLRILTSGENKNIFVVADDDQIIYQWNGASHKRIEEFVAHFNPAVVQLPVNYRCPPEIVELANRLIQHNFLRASEKSKLRSGRPSVGKGAVRVLRGFVADGAEALAVAGDLLERHSPDFSAVVVLARTRKLLEGIMVALSSVGLSGVIAQRKDEFSSTPIVCLHSLLRLANDRQSSEDLEAVCATLRQLAGVEVNCEGITAEAEAGNRDYFMQWCKETRRSAATSELNELLPRIENDLSGRHEFLAFCSYFFEWVKGVIDRAIDATEVTGEVFANYAEERAVWKALSSEIVTALGADITLEAFLQEMQMRSKSAPVPQDKVRLMTIHGAKGLEFEHVYLVGMAEDYLPSFQSKKKGRGSPEMEEERRNCFVAITRAEETLTLSYADQYGTWPKSPSRFLNEMGLGQLD